MSENNKQIDALIDELHSFVYKTNENAAVKKYNDFHQLIELKHNSNSLFNTSYSLSPDIVQWIQSYKKVHFLSSHQYDQLSYERLTEVFKYISDIDERTNLIKYAIQNLESLNLDYHPRLKKLYKINLTQKHFKSNSILSPIYILLAVSSYNALCLILSLCIFFLSISYVGNLFDLSAHLSFNQISLKPQILNGSLNLIIETFKLDSRVNLQIHSTIGLTIYVLYKGFIFIVISNYILKFLKEKANIHDI